MVSYIKAPLQIRNADGTLMIDRPLQNELSRLDNLVELIVFTPRGSFAADPDFGFEYWNHEYTNVHLRNFANGQRTLSTEVTRQECEDSIRNSLSSYEPSLKHVEVLMELSALDNNKPSGRKTNSKYEVRVTIEGMLADGLGTMQNYSKTIRFLMEPTAKK